MKIATPLIFIILMASSLSSFSKEQLEIKDYLGALEKEGYSLGKKHEKMYQFLMASDGFAIELNGSKIEIYEFDTTITSGKNALEKIKKDGFMGKGLIVNKNLAIMKNKKHEDWEKLKAIFNAL
jgi:hypothetical protein